MKRIETVKDRKTFDDIIRNGNFIKNQHFVIYNKESDNSTTKFGVAVSNKLGKAHIRNKLKRQVRSLIDDNKNMFKNGSNYIIMIRKTCTEADFSSMKSAFISLLENNRVK